MSKKLRVEDGDDGLATEIAPEIVNQLERGYKYIRNDRRVYSFHSMYDVMFACQKRPVFASFIKNAGRPMKPALIMFADNSLCIMMVAWMHWAEMLKKVNPTYEETTLNVIVKDIAIHRAIVEDIAIHSAIVKDTAIHRAKRIPYSMKEFEKIPKEYVFQKNPNKPSDMNVIRIIHDIASVNAYLMYPTDPSDTKPMNPWVCSVVETYGFHHFDGVMTELRAISTDIYNESDARRCVLNKAMELCQRRTHTPNQIAVIDHVVRVFSLYMYLLARAIHMSLQPDTA